MSDEELLPFPALIPILREMRKHKFAIRGNPHGDQPFACVPLEGYHSPWVTPVPALEARSAIKLGLLVRLPEGPNDVLPRFGLSEKAKELLERDENPQER